MERPNRRGYTLYKRLWSKIAMGGEDECWLWTGAINRGAPLPHGRIGTTHGMGYAHIEMYRLHCGDIPPGMCVCHSCDEPRCVNPNHLWLGTKTDNNADMIAKGRAAWMPNAPNWKVRKQIVVQPKRRYGRIKLTDAEVLAVMADQRSGVRVAEDYKVHHTTINRLRAIMRARMAERPDGNLLS